MFISLILCLPSRTSDNKSVLSLPHGQLHVGLEEASNCKSSRKLTLTFTFMFDRLLSVMLGGVIP